jgi:hypothetical protein
MLEHLQELNIRPAAGTVGRDQPHQLPAGGVGRTFGELSSHGLKTLVNVAHALAHHTVAIDRNLSMPGLLILDGLSPQGGSGHPALAFPAPQW